MLNSLPQAGQATTKALTFQEGLEHFGAPPPEEQALPPAPRTLADLVQAYDEALQAFEEATAERTQLAEAHLQAQNDQRALAASLKGLHEDWQDALLSPEEPAAKAALASARAALVELNELVVALNAKKSRLPFDDYSASSRIQAARNEVMEHLSALEMKAFPSSALTVLHNAWAAQSSRPWPEWLASTLAPPPDKGATAQAVMDRHRVVLA